LINTLQFKNLATFPICAKNSATPIHSACQAYSHGIDACYYCLRLFATSGEHLLFLFVERSMQTSHIIIVFCIRSKPMKSHTGEKFPFETVPAIENPQSQWNRRKETYNNTNDSNETGSYPSDTRDVE